MPISSRDTTYTDQCRIKRGPCFIRITRIEEDLSTMNYLIQITLSVDGKHQHFLHNIWGKPKITHNYQNVDKVITYFKWNMKIPRRYSQPNQWKTISEMKQEMEQIVVLGESLAFLGNMV